MDNALLLLHFASQYHLVDLEDRGYLPHRSVRRGKASPLSRRAVHPEVK